MPDTHKRNFFGMGEIIGVLTNPAETVRSLTESRRMLEEARREINENRERSQLRTKHTFSRLPGFFPRKAEVQAIERALEGEPSFTVLFGASSVGKTALLREVLSREKYHVLHFDLRIAGFADLSSLYMSLSQQMQQYFEEISSKIPGYEDFEKEAWSFKHDRINVERRTSEAPSDNKAKHIRTSDVARLMELFQSSLLKYWEFEPSEDKDHRPRRQDSDSTLPSEQTRVEGQRGHKKSRSWFKRKERENSFSTQGEREDGAEAEKKPKVVKKMPLINCMPVCFLSVRESNMLFMRRPALIQSTETMKCLLDSMLVLTKQDRLCHVIHATSDPFYQTWLRQLNVMQHCKIITIGDCSKAETRAYFRERVAPSVYDRLRTALDFETLYDAFGGKLAHWHDYITDFVNSNGTLDIKQSSHFLQAHSLLNLHIIHSSQAPTTQNNDENASRAANASTTDTLHPGLGPAGFHNGQYTPEFSAMQLLKVMSRLSQPETQYIPYFHLCRELGVRAVDGMVKGRVLDLRWTEPVTKEFGEETARIRSHHSGMPMQQHGAAMGRMSMPMHSPMRYGVHGGESSGTAVDNMEPPPPPLDDDEMIPVDEQELGRIPLPEDQYEDVMEIVGPKLVPTTPIMRYAMREVVQEYEDDRSVSEYASLSDVDEY
ncbi:hypothetical protein BDQ17DRAFT_1387454 [Cyathus striatus]|nr:hypothetical protein BDQ17DRAFT_1387454 [Cyathus striatus]